MARSSKSAETKKQEYDFDMLNQNYKYLYLMYIHYLEIFLLYNILNFLLNLFI